MLNFFKRVSNVIGVKETINYIFKIAISDYIHTEEVDVDEMTKEIEKKSFVSLNNVQLNTGNINNDFFKDSPIKVIDGVIQNFNISFDEENKIRIYLKNISCLLMPYFGCPKKSDKEIQSQKKENKKNNSQTIFSKVINSILSNIEIIVEGINIRFLTYEINSNSINNPIISLYISGVNITKKDKEKKECFIDGFQISVKMICVKIENEFKKEVIEPDNIDEFILTNDTIIAFQQDAILIQINKKDEPISSLDISIKLSQLELLINPKELHDIRIFLDVIGIVLGNDEEINGAKKKENLDPSSGEEMDILGYKIKEIHFNFVSEKIVCVLLENFIDDFPKFFSFNRHKYLGGKQQIRKIEEIRSHFSYFGDDYFFIFSDGINIRGSQNLVEKILILNGEIGMISLNYVNNLVKEEKPETSERSQDSKKKSRIGSSSIYSSARSIYQSAQSNDSCVFQSVIDADEMKERSKILSGLECVVEPYEIIKVTPITIKSIMNGLKKTGINEVKIKDVEINFNFIILLQLNRLLYSNRMFDVDSAKATNQSSSMVSSKCSSKVVIRKENKEWSQKELSKMIKQKTHTEIQVGNFEINIHTTVIDPKLNDTNAFFYEYYNSNKSFIDYEKTVQKFKLSEVINKKCYLSIILPNLDVLATTRPTEIDLKLLLSDIILNLNKYTIVSFNKEEQSTISSEQKQLEFTPDNIESLQKKNEAKFQKKHIQVKVKKDLRVSINFYEEIKANIENVIIDEILNKWMKGFMFGFNFWQVMTDAKTKEYNQNLLLSYKDNTVVYKKKKKQISEQISIYIKGEINLLTLMINNDNSINEEGNLVKVQIKKVNVLFIKEKSPLNKVTLDIDDITLGIRKNDANEYVEVFSKYKKQLISCSINFQEKKKGITRKKQDDFFDVGEDNRENYQGFLLTHQVPMENMELNINPKISEIYFFSFYSHFQDIRDSVGKLIKCFTGNTQQESIPIIPLCEDSQIFSNITVNLSALYHEISLTQETKDKWTKCFIILKDVFVDMKDSQKEVNLNKINIYLLNDFTYTKANLKEIEDNIREELPNIGRETSYLRRIGFIEIFYLDEMKLTSSSEVVMVEGDGKENKKKETTKIVVSIKGGELGVCKDSFESLISLAKICNLDLPIEKNESSEEEEEEDEKEVKEANDSKVQFELVENYLGGNLSIIPEVDEEKPQPKKIVEKAQCTSSLIVYQYEEIEQGDIDLVFNLLSLRVNLYGGNDFKFSENSSEIQKSIVEEEDGSQKEPSQPVIKINDAYFNSDNPVQSVLNNKKDRKRVSPRNHLNYVSIKFDELIASYKQFKTGKKLMLLVLTLSKFEVEDHIEGSKFSLMISKYNFEEKKKFFCAKAEMNEINKDDCLDILVELSPFNVLIDYCTLFFLINFIDIKFDFSSTSKEEKDDEVQTEVGSFENIEIETFEINNPESPKDFTDVSISNGGVDESSNKKNEKRLLISSIFIKEFFFNYSYNSDKLSVKKMDEDLLQILNLANITDFRMKFKEYKSTVPSTPTECLLSLILYWKKDIIKNQLMSAVLHSVSYIRPFTAIIDGLIDIVKQPYNSIKKGGNIKEGVGKGVKNFLSNFTIQSVFLGEKFYRLIKPSLGSKKSTALGKNSCYKRWMYSIDEKKRKYDSHFVKK